MGGFCGHSQISWEEALGPQETLGETSVKGGVFPLSVQTVTPCKKSDPVSV